MSPVQPQYLAYVLEQLERLGSLRSNRMFGGIGLYAEGLFFGLIDDDTLFFKTDDTNIAGYRERNMPRFMPFPEKSNLALGYHQVPADVIEDAETLIAWARAAMAVALARQAEKATRARTKSKPPAPAAKTKARKHKRSTRQPVRTARKSKKKKSRRAR